MSADDAERDLRAAEYVLGTLDPRERDAFAASLAGDAAARAAVAAWERRLAPLALATPEEVPGPHVWQAIVRALDGSRPAPANDNRVAALSRQVGRWRMAALGAGLVAAGLAVAMVTGIRPLPAPGSARYVAVVTSGGEAPALIVSVDTVSGIAQVRPVAAQAPSGKSLELWYVGADAGAAPKPLGIIGADAARLSLPPGIARSGEGLFAVSVEPPGGSPTGSPTGPVIYTGKLIRD
ncbi:anti-sigma factor [Methylobacterium sp. sgz302541]|uniref:anti-sigma factor n=1 Tax=unclassified Methylobacterium TaxID=2615210 RepID=UPI003D32C576